MEEYAIRPFTPGDRPLVEAFFAQMAGESRAFFNRSGYNETTALRFFEGTSNNTDYFLMEHEGRMIGYVYLFEMHRSVPWLGIAVHEAYKGQGLGRLLMDHAKRHALAAGKGGILLTTHVANLRGQSLYERMGYERMGMHTSGEILYLLRF